MELSSETIYQCFFVQGHGELRGEPARSLPSGRTKPPPEEESKC